MTIYETPQSRCRCGVATAEITPPPGIYHRMWGAATHDRAEGVHRPLEATVLFLAEETETGESAADASQQQWLIALDHCVLGIEELDILRKATVAAVGAPPDSITVVCSHTHGAGLLLHSREELPGGECIPAYWQRVGQLVAALAQQARGRAETARIAYGVGRCDLARRRDFWDAEREQFVCGFDPAGEADDTLVVGRITSEDDRLLATFVNYACHPTTLAWDNRRISPDFVGAMRTTIQQRYAAPCLFLQGASGDLGPRDGFVGDSEVADRNGRWLGYAAISALESLPPPQTRAEYQGPVVSGATIGTWRHVPLPESRREDLGRWNVRRWACPLPYRSELPTRAAAEAELEKRQAEERAAAEADDPVRFRDARALVERQTRLLARLRLLPDGDAFPLQIAAWRMGDALWLAVQGEPYEWLQTELRRRVAPQPLIVATIAHEWGASYLPPRSAYGKGIYQESVAVLAPGCLETLVEQIAGELDSL